jgi:hypothetical protein
MIVTIIKDVNDKPIGWSMQGENREELNKLIDIRNLQFFGLEETAIEYAGRKGENNKEYNPGILSWKQAQYIDNSNVILSEE